MENVFLLLGSNQGNRFQLLNDAVGLIQLSDLKVVSASSIYESSPWGFVAEQNFLNQVLHVATKLQPQELLQKMQEVEHKLGRARIAQAGYTSRTMDVDILFYGSEFVNTPTLTIPHPRLHLRRFTLAPLVEIAPEFVHPILKKTMRELLEVCEDRGEVAVVKRLGER